jgi:hypothetical protein
MFPYCSTDFVGSFVKQKFTLHFFFVSFVLFVVHFRRGHRLTSLWLLCSLDLLPLPFEVL